MVLTRSQSAKLKIDNNSNQNLEKSEIQDMDIDTEDDDYTDTTETVSEDSEEDDILLKELVNNKVEISGENKNWVKKQINDALREYKRDPLMFNINAFIKSVYNGKFFERLSDFSTESVNLKDEEIKFLNEEFTKIIDSYRGSIPSILDILKMDISTEHKKKLLEKMYILTTTEIFSPEYNSTLKFILANVNTQSKDQEYINIEKQLTEACDKYSDDYKEKIIKSKMSFNNKVIAYKKFETLESYSESNSEDNSKYRTWLDILLSIPFGKYNNLPVNINNSREDINDYLVSVRKILDDKLSFMDKPKDQIINIVSQMIRNKDVPINAIGLHGVAGVGKCHGKGTGVLMYDGSVKCVEDIRVGDVLMGDDSTPRNVLSITSGDDNLYKVFHKTHSEHYIVNSEHILSLKTKTGLIKDIAVKDYTNLDQYTKRHLYGYKTIVEFPEKQLVTPAYIVGRYISSGKKYIEGKYLNYIKRDKILKEYKINSVENRLLLLAGFIDETKQLDLYNPVYYKINCPPSVIHDIIFVCKSLGFITKKIDNVIYIYGDLSKIPVKTHKPIFDTCNFDDDFLLKSEINVTKVGMGEYFGFEIDNNNRYVLSNFIVTHNSSIASSIATALDRPLKTISLGGESDSSTLSGHGFVYIGSGPGRFIDILRECNTMNPVILVDELDKISETKHGDEIIGLLIHLTDLTNNYKYNHDKYFSGIEFDMSKILFIFTYNDANKINKILSDRLYKIRVDNYSFEEKAIITTRHIIPNVLKNLGFSIETFTFPEETIKKIVSVSNISGMRDIKRNVETIVSRINTFLLSKPDSGITNLKYSKLLHEYYYNLKDSCISVSPNHVDILLGDGSDKDSSDTPPFGMYV